MSEDVDYGQLTPGPGEVVAGGVGDLRRLSAVPVDLSVEIGRARMSVGETLELREGSVVTLDRMAGEPVDLLVNGTPIARGEVVVIDEQFGLRLTQVLGPEGSVAASPDADLELPEPATDASPPLEVPAEAAEPATA